MNGLDTAVSEWKGDDIQRLTESNEARARLTMETETYIDWATIAILKGGL